jgi:hypothetical protein
MSFGSGGSIKNWTRRWLRTSTKRLRRAAIPKRCGERSAARYPLAEGAFTKVDAEWLEVIAVRA